MSFTGFIPEPETVYGENISQQQVSTGTPTQSALPAEVATCVEKTSKSNCSFTLQTHEVQGVCKPSGDELACSFSSFE